MNKLMSLIVGVAVLAGAVYFFAPGLWMKFAKAYDEQVGWGNEERRMQDPVGYLEFAQGKLQENLDRIERIIRDLHSHRGELEGLNTELSRNSEAYAALLDQARETFSQAEAGEKAWPVEFRRANYSRDEFVTQIEIIFNQRQLTTRRLEQVQNGLTEIHRYVSSLHAERAQGQGALEDIRTAIVIARAQMATSEVRQIMDTVQDTVLALDKTVSSYERDGIPIRSAEALLDPAPDRAAEASRQEVLKFLQGS